MLRKAADGPESAFVPVYGRRRVGKSELLVHLLKDRPGVYFVGQRAPAAMQIAGFLATAAEAIREPLLAGRATGDWREALTLTIDRWTGSGKLTLVLDEFQWMVEASPELPSVLQELWDRRWRDNGRVMLVLCGSYVGFMEREVLGERSPLFGRRTAQIHLKPFPLREARLFHPSWSLADSARAYAICGGIPAYLRIFDPGRSIEGNIRATLLDEFAPLYREPDFLLREELRDLPNYYATLVALAHGSKTMGEIGKASGIPDRSLPYYLNQLVELGYVRRRHPLTGGAPNPRHVRFTLDDGLLRFWFRFVFPNTASLGQFGGARVFAERIRPQMPSFYGVAFEALCREALPLMYAEEDTVTNAEIGEYWDRDVQIDVVGIRDDGWTDLGECRWGDPGSARALVDDLRRRTGRFPNPRGATVRLCFFTAEAVPQDDGAPPGTRWFDLAALYGD